MYLKKLHLSPKLFVPLILLFGIATAISFTAYRSNIRVSKITDVAQINLPIDLKQRLLSDPDSELLYIDYHNKALSYFFISNNELRTKIILKSLCKIITSLRYSIPEGHYLLALHDAAPHRYAVPVLAFASDQELLQTNDVVLMPDPFALKGYNAQFMAISTKAAKYPWHKKIAKVFFRGSAYGAGPENNDINGFPRLRFMNMAANLDIADVGFTSYTAQLNSQFRAKLAELHPLKSQISSAESQAYKYLIDIDGNTCSFSRMAWILYSNSVLFKHHSNQVQWYYAQLKPYVHYVPVDADFGNLVDQYAWAQANPQAVKNIAAEGHKIALQIFRSDNILRSTAQAFKQYHALTQSV